MTSRHLNFGIIQVCWRLGMAQSRLNGQQVDEGKTFVVKKKD